jgi:hypothetical protein
MLHGKGFKLLAQIQLLEKAHIFIQKRVGSNTLTREAFTEKESKANMSTSII